MASTDRQDEDAPFLEASGTVWRGWRRPVPEFPSALYFMALAILYPVQQFWLFDHFSRQLGVNTTTHDVCANASTTDSGQQNQVESLATQYVMYIGFISNFVAIFPTLFLGPLTDKFGRKFVFYIACLATMISATICLVVFHWDLSPNLLLVSSFILGLSGNYGLFLTAVFSMVADISTGINAAKLSFRVTTLEMTIAFGFSAGVSQSGVWVRAVGYTWPMVFVVGLTVLALLFFLIVIPETYTDRLEHTSCCGNLAVSAKMFVKNTPVGRRLKLNLCLAAFLIFNWCGSGEGNFLTLYLLHQPFCWQKMDISLFNGGYTVSKWIIILFSVKLLKGWIPEPVFALIGVTSAGASYLLKGLANTSIFFIVGTAAGLVIDLVSPMCRSMMSQEVTAKEQGALFSGIGVVQMVISSAAGVTMSFIYKAGLAFFLGLPYMVLAGLCLFNICLLVALFIYMRRQPKETEATTDEDEMMINTAADEEVG